MMNNPLLGLGIALLAGAVVGTITYVVWTTIERRLPGYAAVDEKTRKVEAYLEKSKQGMR